MPSLYSRDPITHAPSKHRFVPALKPMFHPPHELVRHRAVDDAMIKREGQVDHRSDGNRVRANDRALLDHSHPQNGHLRLIDDGSSKQTAKDARIGNGERATLDVV